jgi:hypothetical protein
MKTYRVTLLRRTDVHVTVAADSMEEAQQKARDITEEQLGEKLLPVDVEEIEK